MAEILYGAAVSDALSEKLKQKTDALRQKGINPTLAIIRLGENESDLSYERGAKKKCEAVGININSIVLPETCSQEELISTIENINSDKSIHGCLILRPLPDGIDERKVCETLSQEKDVDCITTRSLSAVFTESAEGYPPCTAEACIEILKHYGVELCGKLCVVIGRSLVIGKPVSMMLQSENATVIMCHSKTENLRELCLQADIIVCAIGRAGFLDDSFVSGKQTVIDVGINRSTYGKICGDVNYDSVEPSVKAITPVPGGVGRVTTTVLAKHLVEAAEKTAL